jgi:hypothetical protein
MDLYDLAVKQGLMTQAEADAARAKANKPTSTTTTTTAPKPTSTKYPTIFSPTAATAFINKVFQAQLKRDATAAELKYWKPLLKAAQTSGGATQKYTVKDKTGIQSTVTGLDEEQWLIDQLASNVDYKKTLKNVDYTTEINAIKTTDPRYYARQEEKKIYDNAIKAAAGDAAKIAAINETTTYGRGLKELLTSIKSAADASGATNTPDELNALAQKLYDKGIAANSAEASAEIDKVLKSGAGLVSDQPADLIKLAADKKIYNKLIAGAAGDPTLIAKAKQTTAYGRGLAEVEAALKAQMATSGAINTAEEIGSLAQELYDSGIKPSSNQGVAKINSALKFGADAATGKYKGTAGTTLAELQTTAAANGLDLQSNFGDQIPGWLTSIANGEQINNIKQQIRDVAKLGQPDSIKKLIDNGTDLKTIYAPYRNTMASVLEIQDPNSIKLDDPTLRMAITPNGELNLYDYQKALRKDTRWQYTQQANQEVADATQKVLKDFGFVG